MPVKPSGERRRADRYDTDLKIQFHVCIAVRTKVCFWIKREGKEDFSQKTYEGVSKNVSVEGLCLVSPKKMDKGDRLLLDVYVPAAEQPVKMEGQVRWCRDAVSRDKVKRFETGIKVLTVNGESVERSVAVDPVHGVLWSIVLESVFSTFKNITSVKAGRGQ